MASKVQAHPQGSYTILFQHGLIKLMVIKELDKSQQTWEYLLFWGGFSTRPSTRAQIRGDEARSSNKTSSTPRKRRQLILSGSLGESNKTFPLEPQGEYGEIGEPHEEGNVTKTSVVLV